MMEWTLVLKKKREPHLKGRGEMFFFGGGAEIEDGRGYFLFYFDLFLIFCLVQDREGAATSACHCNQPDAETGLFYSSLCLIFLPFLSLLLSSSVFLVLPFRIDNDDERQSSSTDRVSVCVHSAE